MARQKNTENLSPVTGSVPAALREAIEEHRWSKRKTVSEVVREALEQWADREGLVYTEGDAEPEGSTDAEKATPKPSPKATVKS